VARSLHELRRGTARLWRDGRASSPAIADENYIVVRLDFPTVEAAEHFRAFLESVIWQSQDLSPGLAGTPQARVLREVDLHA
jgi:hypothetical protein